jgi:hypothetical protein
VVADQIAYVRIVFKHNDVLLHRMENAFLRNYFNRSTLTRNANPRTG